MKPLELSKDLQPTTTQSVSGPLSSMLSAHSSWEPDQDLGHNSECHALRECPQAYHSRCNDGETEENAQGGNEQQYDNMRNYRCLSWHPTSDPYESDSAQIWLYIELAFGVLGLTATFNSQLWGRNPDTCCVDIDQVEEQVPNVLICSSAFWFSALLYIRLQHQRKSQWSMLLVLLGGALSFIVGKLQGRPAGGILLCLLPLFLWISLLMNTIATLLQTQVNKKSMKEPHLLWPSSKTMHYDLPARYCPFEKQGNAESTYLRVDESISGRAGENFTQRPLPMMLGISDYDYQWSEKQEDDVRSYYCQNNSIEGFQSRVHILNLLELFKANEPLQTAMRAFVATASFVVRIVRDNSLTRIASHIASMRAM